VKQSEIAANDPDALVDMIVGLMEDADYRGQANAGDKQLAAGMSRQT
jgi:hypothetical protein